MAGCCCSFFTCCCLYLFLQTVSCNFPITIANDENNKNTNIDNRCALTHNDHKSENGVERLEKCSIAKH